MGGSGGGSRSTSRPWKKQQPYLQELYSEAAGLYGRGPSDLEQEATGLQVERARAGSPIVDASQGLMGSTIRGDFLNANPYVDAMFGQAAGNVEQRFNRTVLPNIETRFGGTGRRGSGAYRNALGSAAGELGDSLSGLATSIYGGNYQQERGRQDAAARFAPVLAETDYQDINKLRQAGLEPWERLGRYSAAIGQPVMSSTQSSEEKGWLMKLLGL